MVSTAWKKFKEEFEKVHKGTSSIILDYIAVQDILYFCVCGLSNFEIAYVVDEDTDYIQSVLEEFLGISGFKNNLDFSPYESYLKLKGKKISSDMPYFTICKKYDTISIQVEEYYRKDKDERD